MLLNKYIYIADKNCNGNFVSCCALFTRDNKSSSDKLFNALFKFRYKFNGCTGTLINYQRPVLTKKLIELPNLSYKLVS